MKPPNGGPKTGAINAGHVMMAMACINEAFDVLRTTTNRATGVINAALAPLGRKYRKINLGINF